jgi:hypothetical protein
MKPKKTDRKIAFIHTPSAENTVAVRVELGFSILDEG